MEKGLEGLKGEEGLKGGRVEGEGVERWSRVGWACRSLVNTSRAETDFRRHPIMGSLLAAPLEKLGNLRTNFFASVPKITSMLNRHHALNKSLI